MPRISDARLLADVRRVAREVGHQPTLSEYRRLGTHASDVLYRRFGGSWEAVITAAGLLYRKQHPKGRYSDDDVARDLRRVRNELGHLPTYSEYDELGKISSETVRLRGGGRWRLALVKYLGVGIDEATAAGVRGRYRRTSSRLGALRHLAKTLGRSPRRHEADKAGLDSHTLTKRIGPWPLVLEAAGLAPAQRLVSEMTNNELLADVVRVARALGRVPSSAEQNTHGRYSHTLLTNRLGEGRGWRRVRERVIAVLGWEAPVRDALEGHRDASVERLRRSDVEAVRAFFGREVLPSPGATSDSGRAEPKDNLPAIRRSE